MPASSSLRIQSRPSPRLRVTDTVLQSSIAVPHPVVVVFARDTRTPMHIHLAIFEIHTYLPVDAKQCHLAIPRI